CMDMMTNFVERSSIYIYGGFTVLSGVSNCNSSGDPQNVADTQGHKLFMNLPGTHIYATSYDPVTGQSVVTILQPVYAEASLPGYVPEAISHDLLRTTHATSFTENEDKLLTFSGKGEILS